MKGYCRSMLATILLTAAQPVPSVEAADPDCSYDLEAMLELDRDAFDQDLPDGGWRALSQKGCAEEAAELIREWRHEKRDHTSVLYTHTRAKCVPMRVKLRKPLRCCG